MFHAFVKHWNRKSVKIFPKATKQAYPEAQNLTFKLKCCMLWEIENTGKDKKEPWGRTLLMP